MTVADRPAITYIVVTNDLVILTWLSIAGETYEIQSTDALPATNWLATATVQAMGASASATNAVTAGDRFHRVRWVAP